MGLSEVIILATLHQMHSQVPGYGFQELSTVIEKLKPAAVIVELQSSEISGYPKVKIRGSKVEYNKAILPIANKLKIPIIALGGCPKSR